MRPTLRHTTLLLFTLLLTGCLESRQVSLLVDNINARVEVAASPKARQRGLMYRESMGKDEGLLMIFPEPQEVSLWMLNTRIPLDVGFFDDQGVLRAVVSMQPDGGKQLYHSPPDTRYALEMNRGWFARYALAPGARLKLPYAMTGE
ncbi:DUF192 domain-containing protein [Sedimenticola hydrogenitrophicus]|uniref:DUF192 domain-containing protein n=1 Tax=Sedimenticola hydrogenitrophicus TaxID=2967975 RepID=UPI0023B1998D|nr:DUF192 domain-containing protein [Sedimenticola hydrogenitrophicus]